ncbi:MAG: hypothetical protein E5X49_32285 [Mesorhizobium sp.]|uniref:hypothetical protein n=1 Tax=Mesorhizobium sp. TaxID=1871066 RepID=UPI000FE38CD3|nr:hypothetical protein [Mesorhizobium sp.]RWG78365.1 MAG: hypothetical protein EOQ69_26455 [Mesorhizobium sp.]RWJ97321.1 MAG: hypothetical protein EOR42_28690 [Mesorhizobium sp.]RWK17554.1 MAG: hypothetical protein EOR43_27685 [Mesorhizobium sp.]RWK27048.1 MAG: hypothetical protein EOR44_29015 [Mesorhizobium sp.]TIQ36798.1 MAG: hypothetical protein E5X49_32285 [Mesorhizobium sp.]
MALIDRRQILQAMIPVGGRIQFIEAATTHHLASLVCEAIAAANTCRVRMRWVSNLSWDCLLRVGLRLQPPDQR